MLAETIVSGNIEMLNYVVAMKLVTITVLSGNILLSEILTVM